MLKCDRCNDNYKFTPTMVQGKRSDYLLCPLCSYDLRRHIDGFVNTNRKNWTDRVCGHIVAYIKDLRKYRKRG